ncbi:endonuclease/exonuclease/phosphatase family protein [Daejeonella lutea]|uniref:Metal-dependent hydrolase, endonuclease/exonuclease/phosphatase family n=1 Tax=Daejeonella lutea TaxID=572036 RepID=A0A1T5DW36_9SPHI|nr:endonuclease/exonuclease/phosphatase family protein [Daejeonella lutea]SKB75937.1 Metal-dependent hydrolase, endonuclease/exonuclease/phosphatase family [Daejeonella lutea]
MRSYTLILIPFLLALNGSKAQTLQVMSYNIHVGQDAANMDQLKNMARFIKMSKADIVGLQEVDSVCRRSGNVDQMKFLAEATGMYYAYARHFAFDGGSYGIGILSKFPLSDVKDHRIILTSDGKSAAATRALLTAKIARGKAEILFATVHMDYRDSNSRLAQSGELVKLLGAVKSPVILTGDFNAEPGTAEIIALKSILIDTGKDDDLSFPAVKPVKKIDYVMVSKADLVKAKGTRVYPVVFSDHLPLMSHVKIKSRDR